jgi:SSS family solute:Na+ symporter
VERASSRGAIATLVAAPLFAFGIEAFYNAQLGTLPAVQALFGPKLNFMHRVFLTFLFSLGVHAVASRLLPDRDARVSEDTLAPGLPVRQMLVVAACLGGLVLT